MKKKEQKVYTILFKDGTSYEFMFEDFTDGKFEKMLKEYNVPYVINKPSEIKWESKLK